MCSGYGRSHSSYARLTVRPEHGQLRLEYCGALMITGDRVQGVEADRIVFERTAARRDKPG